MTRSRHIALLIIMGSVSALSGATASAPLFSRNTIQLAEIPVLFNMFVPSPISCTDTTLLFTGDIMLSRAIGKIMERENNFAYPFEKIAPLTRAADISFGNLENPISARGTNIGSIYSFRADPRSIAGLLNAGFDVLSIANNHIYDYGPDAFADTVQLLSSVGIRTVGGAATSGDAHAPVRVEADGTRVSYFAYTNLLPQFLLSEGASPAIAGAGRDSIVADIARERPPADIVVVSLHWGDEYETEAYPSQVEFARSLIDAGADIVVGHHPHVVQGFERYKNGIIAYSLGNFIFDQNFSADTRQGAMLSVYVGGGEVCGADKTIVRFTDTFQPYVVSTEKIF